MTNIPWPVAIEKFIEAQSAEFLISYSLVNLDIAFEFQVSP